MVEGQEVESVQESEPVEAPAAVDYDSMSADELDNLMREEAQSAIAPAPVEQKEVPVEQVAVDESNEEEATDEPPSVENEPEQELDDRDLQLQELRLQLEREHTAREQANMIAGRNAGMMGHLKKQIEQLSAEHRRPASANDPLDYEDAPTAESARFQPQPPVAPSRYEEEVAELRTAHRNNTVKEVYSDFLNRIASDLTAQGVEQERIAAEQQSLIEQISPTLQERFEPFGDLSEMKSQSVGKITRMVLDSAYTDAKLAKVAELRRVNLERKASQIADSRIVKQAASPSGSGGKSVKEPPPKNVEDMTAEEADAALIALYGDGRYRPRR